MSATAGASSDGVLEKKNTCRKITAGEDQNQYVRIASEVSQNDKAFLALLDAENSLWQPLRLSKMVGANGYRDQGFCQINRGWHSNIVQDKRFKDPRWQLEQCWKLYKGGTKFYGERTSKNNLANFECD